MKFVQIPDDIYGNQRYVNPQYITDITEFKSGDKETTHCAFGLQKAHGGIGAGGVRIEIENMTAAQLVRLITK